jgi:hypothetical protein
MLAYADVCWRMLTYADVCYIYLQRQTAERELAGVCEETDPAYVIRQHTSAYVSIRQHTSACAKRRILHTSCVSIRHTSADGSCIRHAKRRILHMSCVSDRYREIRLPIYRNSGTAWWARQNVMRYLCRILHDTDIHLYHAGFFIDMVEMSVSQGCDQVIIT